MECLRELAWDEGVVLVVLIVVVVGEVVVCDLNRSGSVLCWGQLCHGMPQAHLQWRMCNDLWHWLHHNL